VQPVYDAREQLHGISSFVYQGVSAELMAIHFVVYICYQHSAKNEYEDEIDLKEEYNE